MRTACLLFGLLTAIARAAEPVPLTAAHAHNDYEHKRPLFDALDRGFCSIEPDIYLVDGQLLVAHNRKDVKPERTLTALYLDPLRERVRRNGGRVYRNGPSVTLLVDIKSDAAPTYAVLDELLKTYAEMLTTFRGDRVDEHAITVIISGNRPIEEMTAQSVRYAAIDGRNADLDTKPPATLVPLISENWEKFSTWHWKGAMPEADAVALRAWVGRAHAQGRKVRFWNTPDTPAAWRALRDAGVDILGADDLAGLQRFLLAP